MRAGIEKHLLKHWYGTHRPPWYLRMLEPVYRSVYRRIQARQMSAADVYQPGLPLIVVGNITVGGTGKTPLVIALSHMAVEMNLRPGIASTGYGRQGCETVVVHADSDTKICGDEPVLLAKRTGVPVVVATRRSDAIRKLHELGVCMVISDDGLQQADLHRGVNICVVDGGRGLGNGHLLPAGPLRETPERLALVDWVITNGTWADKPEGLNVSVMQLQTTVVQSLDGKKSYTLEEFLARQQEMPLHAVAAIGNPARFFTMLEQQGMVIIPHSFADHHHFTKQDFASMPGTSAIIMTEKDAVKCRELSLENAWYVPVDAVLPDEFIRAFKDRLAKLTQDQLCR